VITTAAKYVTAAGSRASTDPALLYTAVAYVSTAESVVTTAAAVMTHAGSARSTEPAVVTPPRRW
jgi:hypothetical protein